MPKFIATDYAVTINGTNFSSSLASVELPIEVETQDTTAFGATFRTSIAGLQTGSITLEFHQDFGAAAIDSVLYPLLGTNATVTVRPAGTVTSATNPAFTGNFLVTQYSPFSSTIGDLATLSVTWPLNGALTRATA
jgi:hypothetical protein